MAQVDLHVHSTCSDGTFTPEELVDYAYRKGLAAFALTDHDTVSGLDPAIGYAEELAKREAKKGSSVPVLAVIPGIELSTEYNGRDVHIVGLFIDHHNQEFLARLKEFSDSRTTRNIKMCELLQGAGIPITYEALLAEFPDSVITRAHYARYMFDHGYIKSIAEAFDRYVGDHCPYFVPREKVTPAMGVKLILSAGGVPILAHPILYGFGKSELEKLVMELKQEGLVGIEAIYSTYKAPDERKIRDLARKFDLKISGGSDFHGKNKPGLDLGNGYGSLNVPYSVLEDLKSREAQIP